MNPFADAGLFSCTYAASYVEIGMDQSFGAGPLRNEIIAAIAQKHNRSPAQVRPYLRDLLSLPPLPCVLAHLQVSQTQPVVFLLTHVCTSRRSFSDGACSEARW